MVRRAAASRFRMYTNFCFSTAPSGGREEGGKGEEGRREGGREEGGRREGGGGKEGGRGEEGGGGCVTEGGRHPLPIMIALPLGSIARYCPGTIRRQPLLPNVSWWTCWQVATSHDIT